MLGVIQAFGSVHIFPCNKILGIYQNQMKKGIILPLEHTLSENWADPNSFHYHEHMK